MPRILTVLPLFLTGLLGQAVSAQQVTFDATQGVKIELPANQPNTLQVYVYDQYTNLIINGKFEHFPQGVDESTSKRIRVYGGGLKDEVTLQGFSTVANPEIYLKGGDDLFYNYLNQYVTVEGGEGDDTIHCGNFGSFVFDLAQDHVFFSAPKSTNVVSNFKNSKKNRLLFNFSI